MRALALSAIAFGVLVAGTTGAQPSPTTDEAGAALDAFHAALATGDRAGALEMLDPAVVIFEAGGAELSRDEYERHHLAADMEFAAATTTERVDRRSGEAGDLVWALTRSRTSGVFRGERVSTDGVESALLIRTGDGWRILHLHWSSAARP